MEKRPFISVIIPVFNAAGFITDAVESILNQNNQNLEIIIIDDGSTDNTAEKVAQFSHALYIYQPNSGPAAARNHGIKLSQGELIGLLDADDLWPLNSLDARITALMNNADADIVLGQVQYQRAIYHRAKESADEIKFENFSTPCFAFNLGSALFRRAVFDRAGLFDAGLRYSEDIDWFLRARETGLQISKLDQITLLYRIHADNSIKDRATRERHFLKALKVSLDRRRAFAREAENLPNLIQPENIARDYKEREPLVSIIVTVKNGARFLAEALDSIFAQTFRDFEVILIDGKSTDDTLAIAARYREIRIISQLESGIANAYNLGISAARGEYIAFLSHDDRWTPEKLSAQVEYLNCHPEIEYLTAHATFFLEPGCALPSGMRKELLNGSHPAHIMETLIARRAFFERIGGFNPELSTAEDVDWFARAKDNQIPTDTLPSVLLNKRIHDSNTSLNTETNNRNLLKALRESLIRKRKKKEF